MTARTHLNPRISESPTEQVDGVAGPVGIAFTPFETRTELIARFARDAENLTLKRVDIAEGWTNDATILVAELAATTSRISLGTSVVSAWARTPATIALAAAGLQRLSSGRFSLGIGASSPPLTEGFHGVAWERPLTRLRDTLTGVRALLSGDRLPNPARGARPLRLAVLPEVPVPIVLAALSSGSIRLAGELADGWAPFLWARSRVNDGRALLREGESRSELATPTRISAGVPLALGVDERRARELAAWWLATYLTRMGPIYRRMLSERFAMAAGVDAVLDAVRAGKAELPSAAEELAHEVTLMGTYDQAGEAIAGWFAAGADEVNLVLPPNRPEDELAEMMQVLASAAAAGSAQSARVSGGRRLADGETSGLPLRRDLNDVPR